MALVGLEGASIKSRREQIIDQTDNRKRAVALKLTVVARQLGRRFDQAVERIGLSRAKFGVIAVVSRQPGATQRIIAEALEVTEATAGRLIERLCEDGYLERSENPADRRAHCVRLTPATKPVFETLGEIAAAQENETFVGLDDEDLATLEALLEIIARNIAKARAQPDSTVAQGVSAIATALDVAPHGAA